MTIVTMFDYCVLQMVLPHIECPTSERVCDGCKSVAQLLVKGVDTSMVSFTFLLTYVFYFCSVSVYLLMQIIISIIMRTLPTRVSNRLTVLVCCYLGAAQVWPAKSLEQSASQAGVAKEQFIFEYQYRSRNDKPNTACIPH